MNDDAYLGNIISLIWLPKQGPLKKMHSFLCDQAQRASLSVTSKIKAMVKLPVDVMLKPILVYGSDTRGLKSKF